MGRTAEFDRQTALMAATKLFWRQGYGATSMAQLLDKMGLSRSSLYGAFGNKRKLYREVLDNFAEMARQLFEPLTAIDDPQLLVQRYFELAFSNKHTQRDGCLLVNTILEQAGVDEALAEVAASKLDIVETILADGFQRAQDAGRLSLHHSPRSLARLLMTITQGMRVTVRIASRKQLDGVIDTVMQLLAVEAQPGE